MVFLQYFFILIFEWRLEQSTKITCGGNIVYTRSSLYKEYKESLFSAEAINLLSYMAGNVWSNMALREDFMVF